MSTDSTIPLAGMPAETVMERLSIAYVMATASQAGLACDPVNPDFGTDLSVRGVQRLESGKLIDTSPLIRIQAKSTTDWEERDGDIVWDCKANAYNKLVSQDRIIPLILVLYCMPKDSEMWFCASESEAVFRKCAYWWLPPAKALVVENSSSKRIAIPSRQRFDAPLLAKLTQGFRSRTWP